MKREELVEIKKDKTGTGLLIEHDGYIKANTDLLKENANGEWHCPYPFIVDAVFQKADVKNANGRIYPRNILEREIERYQEKIREHRALGECYTPDVLVLCEDGWKCISSVTEDDSVLTLNTTTNEIEIQKITKKIEYDYDGDMIRLESRNISDFVTPNHGYPVYNEKDSFVDFFTANDIFNDNINDCEKCYIPKFVPSFANGVSLNKNQLNVTKEYYNGKVMCIEVPNHTFYVMSNGKCHWSKNCNHPSDSTIDLGRISHNIIELHWEGNTVVGKLELNISEGFRRNGICSTFGDTIANLLLNGYKIGVSSRAVGSVEQKLGVLMVGDDLELICWDVVSDPSTPGAWMGQKEELQQYVETKTSSNSVINEKINKIKNILKS